MACQFSKIGNAANQFSPAVSFSLCREGASPLLKGLLRSCVQRRNNLRHELRRSFSFNVLLRNPKVPKTPLFAVINLGLRYFPQQRRRPTKPPVYGLNGLKFVGIKTESTSLLACLAGAAGQRIQPKETRRSRKQAKRRRQSACNRAPFQHRERDALNVLQGSTAVVADADHIPVSLFHFLADFDLSD